MKLLPATESEDHLEKVLRWKQPFHMYSTQSSCTSSNIPETCWCNSTELLRYNHSRRNNHIVIYGYIKDSNMMLAQPWQHFFIQYIWGFLCSPFSLHTQQTCLLDTCNSMHAASQDFVDLKDLCSVRFFNFLEEMFHRSYIHGDVQRFELFQRKTLYKYLYYY